MGEPNLRLNPKVESRVKSILIQKAIAILLYVFMLLPIENKNKNSWDLAKNSLNLGSIYRLIITIKIIKITPFPKRSNKELAIELPLEKEDINNLEEKIHKIIREKPGLSGTVGTHKICFPIS